MATAAWFAHVGDAHAAMALRLLAYLPTLAPLRRGFSCVPSMNNSLDVDVLYPAWEMRGHIT